ncbi:hypothetical protein STRCI_008162 [Streptomyces cinnabarinus]|uniref:Uncharacterized protein n=1 Tax=Streptomyces cinnabarinus TaxID=67287 RepID=A0ABY7KSQ5_9ACTN|nr:hypothetical protein [Streptomyces cinnabarinus]WAZ26568.1 hypothetical protein STRCI_008162 [Streptomyces cinnabarinus]
MTSDRHDLDTYLQSVNEQIQTTKMSSEMWFRSPSRHQIHVNDRFVRSLMQEGLAPAASPLTTSAAEQLDRDPSDLRSAYWAQATRTRDIAVRFGAADHASLHTYFTADPGRSSQAAGARARRTVTPSSPADYLIRSIDRLTATTGSHPADSWRKIMRTLAHDWPRLVHTCQASPDSAVPASHILREFYHATERENLPSNGPKQTPPSSPGGSPSIVLTEGEAREMATSYMLGRLPFTAQEYDMAARLVTMPRLQSALLAVQLQLTASSVEPLTRLVAGIGTPRVLLPFTEAFVDRFDYSSPARIDLCPNPKLITVLCNNVVPAIAGELIRKRARAADLDSESIRAGVIAARRRHIYEIAIALFNRADTLPRHMITLSGFNRRVCPAAAPFSAFLEQWLPYHFDRHP